MTPPSKALATAALAWTLTGSRLAGVLLAPVVCAAHATATLWVWRNTGNAVRLLLLVPFLITLALLACAVLLLMVLIGADGRCDAAAATAVCGLLFCYLFTFAGAGQWMLRWQGTEATCTMLGVDARKEMVITVTEPSDGHSPEVTRYDYTMRCAAAGAPEAMTSETRDWEAGEKATVVYDPSGAWGDWGARPAQELGLGGTMSGVSAVVAGAGTAAWTVPALCCALAGLRRR